jgi:hypothetical protein
MFGNALSIFTFLAEMDFDAWREDKGEHTGGIPQRMLRMLRIPQRQAIEIVLHSFPGNATEGCGSQSKAQNTLGHSHERRLAISSGMKTINLLQLLQMESM